VQKECGKKVSFKYCTLLWRMIVTSENLSLLKMSENCGSSERKDFWKWTEKWLYVNDSSAPSELSTTTESRDRGYSIKGFPKLIWKKLFPLLFYSYIEWILKYKWTTGKENYMCSFPNCLWNARLLEFVCKLHIRECDWNQVQPQIYSLGRTPTGQLLFL
jgi:hypothetical protein